MATFAIEIKDMVRKGAESWTLDVEAADKEEARFKFTEYRKEREQRGHIEALYAAKIEEL